MLNIDLSIIIVNWNTRELLAQCLDSVYKHPPSCEFEVWVVDNASSDGSAMMVRERFPQARLIGNRANLGFARANNQAIRASLGRYALLLNSDTIVQPNGLSEMCAFMDKHLEAGIVGGKLEWPDGSFQSSFNDFPSFFSELLTLTGLAKRMYGPYFPSYGPEKSQKTRVVDWVGGAFLIVRKEAITEVGLLDEGYFMYGEEMDWCYRMKEKGWKVYYLTEASVVHLSGGSSRAPGFEKLLWLTCSRIRFFRKYRGAFAASVLGHYASIACFLKAAIWLGIGFVFCRRRAYAWTKADANWRLMRSNLFQGT